MKKKKTIWIINEYASTTSIGMGGRSYYLARELVKQGYQVYLIASAPHHLLRVFPKLVGNYTFEMVDGIHIVWIKVPSYKHAHSKQRVLNWFLFAWKLQKLRKIINDKPDVILVSSPSLVAYLGAERLSVKLKSKLVFEVRDIWPLSLIRIGGYSPKNPFIRFLQWIEDRAYQKSDHVISNLENAVEHMVSRGMDRNKFIWIANGFSLDEVNSRMPIKQEIEKNIPKNKLIIGYVGTLGKANSMDVFLKAARILKNKKEICFIIVGDGGEKEYLKSFAMREGLSNVVFIDPIPKRQVQSMLSYFDACYLGWADDDLYRFGIAANKIPDYLYSGKPIIHSYSGSCDPVNRYSAGLIVKAQNEKELADAVLIFSEMPKEKRDNMGKRGREAALSAYEYTALAQKLALSIF